ncbi:DNA mismatch repair protein MutT [Kitasatospora sp. MMS16-BH015]|uniref:NUDIX domain-containing protein n=1 Tax=Kitasatospora sp. MMS16-BH015 TaxID=2018025 RepID=UPI000CA36E96|nr:NUDIX hydrolase [Kitasatospora sp. MMS16-BH015]AUG80603.1 DNA mismatch repair protein MutT [Kitasatospora sp. MMS16-BH015]
MTSTATTQRTLAAAAADARLADARYDEALSWLARTDPTEMDPFGTEVWVFDEDFTHLLLVQHRWRGLVPPGGGVEHDETPREGAIRELSEETGLRPELHPTPVAVTIRSYQSGWAPTLGFTYSAVVPRSSPLTPEPDQPLRWTPLTTTWATAFPEDTARARRYAARLATARA